MSLIFSKSCEYAVRASLYLAQQPDDQFVLLRHISDRLDIPYHFLSKVLQTLVRADIVVSSKGTNGGFSLSRSPEDIRLIDIVRAVDGEKSIDECVLGFPGCGSANPCPIHFEWQEAKGLILDMLNKKTLAELGEDLDAKLDLLAELSE